MSASIHRRSSTLGFVAALVIAAALGFAVFDELGSGGKTRTPSTSAVFVPEAEYAERAPHVDSMTSVIGIQGSVRGQAATPASEQPPISAGAFARPVAEYLAYSVRQLGLMESEVSALQTALESGDRAASEAAWRAAWSRYLRLGGVYLEGPVATLNQAIDGGPGGLPGGTSNPGFVGLHRIEFGLWAGAPPETLARYAVGLAANVRKMRTLLPHTAISPLGYATRTHEILEDAVRDLLSGAAVPWSGEGVLGTQAGVIATRELISTLLPLLHEPAALAADPPANPRSPAVVDADLNELQSVLTSLSKAHAGQLPTNQQLTQIQSERLDAAIGQALEGLAQVPGMLETAKVHAIPRIPRSQAKLDP